MSALDVGFYGDDFDSPVYRLTQLCGSRLEQVTCGDKLALVAVLCGWLSEDDEAYDLPQAMKDCGLEASDRFCEYINVLKDGVEHVTPKDAIALCSALMAQVSAGVYLR